jgi:hypothetical protein
MEKDVEALILLIRYSEEEAMRLGLPAVVIECLRMAGEELTKSTAGSLVNVQIDDHRTH